VRDAEQLVDMAQMRRGSQLDKLAALLAATR
jgi:hypothetical protein